MGERVKSAKGNLPFLLPPPPPSPLLLLLLFAIAAAVLFESTVALECLHCKSTDPAGECGTGHREYKPKTSYCEAPGAKCFAVTQKYSNGTSLFLRGCSIHANHCDTLQPGAEFCRTCGSRYCNYWVMSGSQREQVYLIKEETLVKIKPTPLGRRVYLPTRRQGVYAPAETTPPISRRRGLQKSPEDDEATTSRARSEPVAQSSPPSTSTSRPASTVSTLPPELATLKLASKLSGEKRQPASTRPVSSTASTLPPKLRTLELASNLTENPPAASTVSPEPTTEKGPSGKVPLEQHHLESTPKGAAPATETSSAGPQSSTTSPDPLAVSSATPS